MMTEDFDGFQIGKRKLEKAKLIMKMKLITIVVATFGLAASPALLAQGCCTGGSAMKEGCSMGATAVTGGHEGHGTAQAATLAQNPSPKSIFAKPVQAVFDSYIKVQGTLAQDSLKDVSSLAAEMVKAIQDDSNKVFSKQVTAHAGALAQAKDLATARSAFKDLSSSLIEHLKDQKVSAGLFREAYCPMVKATWLQTGSTILNPYMGKSMVHCGEFKI